MGPAPLTLEPDVFEAGLTTRQDSSVVGELGHEVSPSAPAGIVSGLASVAAPDEPHPDGRGPELALRGGGTHGGGFTAARKVDYGVQRRPGSIATPGPTPPAPSSSGPEFSPPELPVRTLPTAPAPTEHPVTHAEPPDEPRPLPVAALPEATEPSPEPTSTAPDAAVHAEAADGPADVPTLAQRAPAEDVPAQAQADEPLPSEVQRAAEEPSLPLATPPTPPRERTQRRVGLGEPLRQLPSSSPAPATPPVQRSATPPSSSPPPAAAGPAATPPASVQRSAEEVSERPDPGPPSGSTPDADEVADPARAPLLGADPGTEDARADQPAPADAADDLGEPSNGESGAAPLPLAGVQRAKQAPGGHEDERGASDSDPIAPLLGSEPSPSGTETLAASDPEPTAGGPPDPTAGGDAEPELPLGVQRAPASPSPGSASPLAAPAPTPDAPPTSAPLPTAAPTPDAPPSSPPLPTASPTPDATGPVPPLAASADGDEPGTPLSPLLGGEVELTVTDDQRAAAPPGADEAGGQPADEAVPLPLATQRAPDSGGSSPQTHAPARPRTAPLLGEGPGPGASSELATSLAPHSAAAPAVQRALEVGPATRASLRSTPSGPIAPLLHARATPMTQRAPSHAAQAHPGGAASRSEAAPAAVVQRVAEATGADLSGVSVQRGGDVALSASAMSAKAYTTGGQVHLPDHHGSTTSGEGESLVAHELTHVAQQRALGGALPGEDTPFGQELELQAQHVERSVADGKPLPLAVPTTGHTIQRSAQPASHTAAPGAASATSPDPAAFAVAHGLGVPTPDGGVVFHAAMDAGVLASVTEPTEAPVQRAVDDTGSDPTIQRFIGKVPPPVTAASASMGSAAAALQAAAPAGGGGDGEDVEKIVDQVITRLRTELSLNRERLGRSLDL